MGAPFAGRARLDADLDNLTADGTLTENQRARFVADRCGCDW